jgi:hypothetical protein
MLILDIRVPSTWHICRSWVSCFISIIKPIVNPEIDINKRNIKIEINSSYYIYYIILQKLVWHPYRLTVPYVYSYLKQYNPTTSLTPLSVT